MSCYVFRRKIDDRYIQFRAEWPTVLIVPGTKELGIDVWRKCAIWSWNSIFILVYSCLHSPQLCLLPQPSSDYIPGCNNPNKAFDCLYFVSFLDQGIRSWILKKQNSSIELGFEKRSDSSQRTTAWAREATPKNKSTSTKESWRPRDNFESLA